MMVYVGSGVKAVTQRLLPNFLAVLVDYCASQHGSQVGVHESNGHENDLQAEG